MTAFLCCCAARLVLVEILAGHVVFGNFTRSNFLPRAISGVFDSRDHSCLERVSFFQQLVDTFRVRALDAR